MSMCRLLSGRYAVAIIHRTATATHPIAAATHPIAAGTHPIAAATHPIAAATHPIAAATHPIAAATHPIAAATHPIAAATHPIAAATHPIAAASHPIAAATHPIAASTHPIAAATHPIAAATHPIAAATPTAPIPTNPIAARPIAANPMRIAAAAAIIAATHHSSSAAASSVVIRSHHLRVHTSCRTFCSGSSSSAADDDDDGGGGGGYPPLPEYPLRDTDKQRADTTTTTSASPPPPPPPPPSPPPPVAVLLLSGLPYASSASGPRVAAFLGPGVTLRLLVPTFLPSGLPRGESFVVVGGGPEGAEEELSKALARNGDRMGGRYVTVTQSSLSQLELAQETWRVSLARERCVRLRGLLYEASVHDVQLFFPDIPVETESVTLCVDEFGRGSGLGFVVFDSPETAERATRRHGEMMGHRMVEVYRCRSEDIVTVIPSKALRQKSANPGARIPNAASGFRNPRTGDWNSGPDFGYSNPNFQNPATGLQNSPPRFHNPNPGFQNPDPNPGFQNPSPGFQNPNPGFQNPHLGFRNPNSGFQNHNAGFQNPNPGFQNPNPGFQKQNKQFPDSGSGSRFVDPAPGFGRAPRSRRASGPWGGGGGVWRDGVYQNLERSHGEQSSGFCVHMRGLPFEATEQDIREFFSPLVPVRVSVSVSRSGRPTGEADVEFSTSGDAVTAMERDHKHMGRRYIELFLNAPLSPPTEKPPSPITTSTTSTPELAGPGFNSQTESTLSEEEEDETDEDETDEDEEVVVKDVHKQPKEVGDSAAQHCGKPE
ncbi:uncharacterized protein LOC116938030 [Petromyzon marinus]|uniref:uncharacterized protein LOC116938030 n=1 Tax=Petromyzon marinus TaxID=7757 RepID=UPI003F6EB770